MLFSLLARACDYALSFGHVYHLCGEIRFVQLALSFSLSLSISPLLLCLYLSGTSLTGQGIYIASIAKGGAAERSKDVKIGDRLLAVNRIDVSNAVLSEVLALVRGSSRGKLRINLSSNYTDGYRRRLQLLQEERFDDDETADVIDFADLPAGADEVAGGTGRADGMVHVLSIDLQSNGGFLRFSTFFYLCICIQIFIILLIVADSLGIRLSTIEDPATPQGHLAVSRLPITICVS